MSRLEQFSAALAAATVTPWRSVERAGPGDVPIGGFDRDADTAFAVAARDIAADLLEVSAVARAIHARSLLGATYIRAAERRRLRDLLARLDA